MKHVKKAFAGSFVRTLLIAVTTLLLAAAAGLIGTAVCLDCSGYQCPDGEEPIVVASPAPPHCGCRSL